METTTNEIVVPEHYNANQLVTYKVIDNESISFPTIKVSELEWKLDENRRTVNAKNELQSKINQIIDNLTEDYWYNPNVEKETILSEICEILQFSPVKNVEFTARISITGSIEIPLEEAEDFELESYLMDNISVDSYNGNIELDHWDIDNAYEN